MIHRFLLITIILILFTAMFALPPQWEAFQRELGIQAAEFRDSPEQLQARQRATREYEVGDTKTFWRWNLSVMPPTWIQTPATCRAVGAHSYVFVADSEWNVHMTQANVDTIMVRLEQNTPNNPNMGAIEMDVELFGPIPDEIDNDPKLIVFYSALGSFQGSYFDGYFSPYNQVTEAQAQQMNPPGHSNECEMIYMTCYPLSPVAPIRMSVLAHELQHLIHWGQDANEETWLNEGCSELAMVAYGIPDPITGFPSNPDNSLIAWNQQTADYVKVMLFFTYLYEQFGQNGLISDLVADTQNGIASVTDLLATDVGVSFGWLFRHWTIANALDSPLPQAGLYNYESLDLPNFSMIDANAHPAQDNLTIQPYATDYLRLNLDQQPLAWTMQADAGIYVTSLLMDQSGACIEAWVDDPYGFYEFDPLVNEAFEVIFVLSNHNPSSVAYSYFTSVVANSDPLQAPALISDLSCHPNPFYSNCSISYMLAKEVPVSIQIYNLRGQRVRSFDTSIGPKGTQLLVWDGKDANSMPLGSGVYILRISAGNESRIHRLLLAPKP